MSDHPTDTTSSMRPDSDEQGDLTRSRALMRQFFVEECHQPEMAAHILDVAMRLFARKGYAATSVREIVGEAQVTSPMLYYYFKSKEGLFTALVDTLIGSFDARIERVLAEDCTLEQKLRLIAQHHIDSVRDVPMALRFMMSTVFGPSDSAPVTSNKRRTTLIHKIARLFDDAIVSGEFKIYPGLSSFYLAQSFMGLITNQMFFVLKTSETTMLDDETLRQLKSCMSEQNINDVIHLFFHGAGELGAAPSHP
jgi:AcrR family transcriptional regulator